MDKYEKYHFDLNGYIVIKNILTSTEVSSYLKTVDQLERHVLANDHMPPFKKSKFCPRYFRLDLEKGYHSLPPEHDDGDTMIIDDFYNASPVFDQLVGHENTMKYVRPVVQGNIILNNAEIRIRYTGNKTCSHMGGPMSKRFTYNFFRGDIQDALFLSKDCEINCSMVRMLYALHDITLENGPFCVVPGSHKANYHSPYDAAFPEKEPGMIGIEMKAGDAILFTENLRHGGFPNHSSLVRKTIHMGFGPEWLRSQNMATHDEEVFILEETYNRYSEEQKKLFVSCVSKNFLKYSHKYFSDREGKKRMDMSDSVSENSSPGFIKKIIKCVKKG